MQNREQIPGPNPFLIDDPDENPEHLLPPATQPDTMERSLSSTALPMCSNNAVNQTSTITVPGINDPTLFFPIPTVNIVYSIPRSSNS
jgi:hypothetical protein